MVIRQRGQAQGQKLSKVATVDDSGVAEDISNHVRPSNDLDPRVKWWVTLYRDVTGRDVLQLLRMRRGMKGVLVVMAGVGFTLGVVFGLLLQLPADTSLPTNSLHPEYSSYFPFRSRRSLSNSDVSKLPVLPDGGQRSQSSAAEQEASGKQPSRLNSAANPIIRPLEDDHWSPPGGQSLNNEPLHAPLRDPQRPSTERSEHSKNSGVKMRINLKSKSGGYNETNVHNISVSSPGMTQDKPSTEDISFLSGLVHGVTWAKKFLASCPRGASAAEISSWRTKATNLDVVKMEEGCGRMQNRILTLRDASKACARYRLNTDQIQGEIFSYYLARLLNISNIPPTVLVQVDGLSPKWRTVHLDMSLAQWADHKLVVLTEFIPDLTPAHIPEVFRSDAQRLEPTVGLLASKTGAELCELAQWSDLIVLDYLTANLDRVINNMFNRQWNDQMMHNPAHNLEKHADGRLVFFDNESGLFHGYRLLDKYARYHESLLNSLCVFTPTTVEAVKRLQSSGNIDAELHALFSENEALHEQLAGIPEKNVKILERRLRDVYEQIVRCERDFHR